MESWLQANFDVGTVGTEIFHPPNSDFSFTQYQVFQFFQVIFELGSQNFVVICGYLWYVSRFFHGFFQRRSWIIVFARNRGHQSFGCQLDPC